MKRKGFATSAILYTMLLLFLVLMVGILNNLQNKKTVLDALKIDTIDALEKDTLADVILEQLGVVNASIEEVNNKILALQEQNIAINNRLDGMVHSVSEYKLVNTTTTHSDTGVSVTIPAKSYFCITALLHWNTSCPSLISIDTMNGNEYAVLAAGEFLIPGSHNVSATYCGYELADKEYVVRAQSSRDGLNEIHLNGFYITP